jgi:abortive infection alpha-like protein
MSEEIKALEESAKAAQEIAKTTGKGIDVGEKFGRFIAQYISGPLEQASGIFEDKLKYLRWERQVRLIKRADDFMKEIGMPDPTRAVPLKLAIPLLQGGSLEDDDDLQDLWARLLVNAADDRSPVTIKRVFVDILQSIGPLEAKILQMLYALPFDEMQRRGVLTADMPNSVKLRPNNPGFKLKSPSQEVELALANLKRLGCLSHAMTWGGGETFSIVNLTILGSAFVAACTLRGEPPTLIDSRR